MGQVNWDVWIPVVFLVLILLGVCLFGYPYVKNQARDETVAAGMVPDKWNHVFEHQSYKTHVRRTRAGAGWLVTVSCRQGVAVT